jgi:hypothetical protein
LAKILVGDGTKDIPVGTLVAIVVDDKDDVRSSSLLYSTSAVPGMAFQSIAADVHGKAPIQSVHETADSVFCVPSRAICDEIKHCCPGRRLW